ncbi:MAG: signal peptidase I [Elusimicrobia bacterium]|nr:MAG: signal peptidase I [Elusimicrobiota bacterium]KAF0154154.1 MAG: signal peptidase I [Elusimicrobiota bacterium]
MKTTAVRAVTIALITLAAALLGRTYIMEPIYIASASMEPTLSEGTHFFLDKLTYRFRAPRRGEVIAFKPRAGGEIESVKRVIAVGGDEVEIRAKQVWVNGEPLVESYAEHRRGDVLLDGDNLGPFKVPDGHLFVLGDNRDHSLDSSVWRNPGGERDPFLPLSEVTGKLRGAFY